MELLLNDRVTLHPGDCLDVLARLEECSVDSVVCDPPYHLTSIVKRFGGSGAYGGGFKPDGKGTGAAFARMSRGFMGKQWDGGDIAFQPETWAEVLRVLKPGGHLVAFAGTRTYHRMACAIEDAGFEIRDQIGWAYGSGFPKSHDVSKGIDRAAGAERQYRPDPRWLDKYPNGPGGGEASPMVRQAARTSGEPLQVSDAATDAAREWQGWGTALKPSWEPICLARKPLVGTVAENVQRFGTGAINIDGCRVGVDGGDKWAQEDECCCSSADRAERLKRTAEPGIRASSAAKHAEPTSSESRGNGQGDTGTTDIGCSAGSKTGSTNTSLNIGASGNRPTDPSQRDTKSTISTNGAQTIGLKICNSCGKPITGRSTTGNTSARPKTSPRDGNSNGPAGNVGRWPANLVHDGSDEVVAAFPESEVSGSARNGRPALRNENRDGVTSFDAAKGSGVLHNDTGSAARFFYTAKADSDDRIGSKHPTVKPIDLMQWLVRLVTPPGGLVLDPFAGTGTTAEAAFREGMRAVLIEREEEYQADIRRRMALVLAGPDERQHASIKASGKTAPAGPLFESEWDTMWKEPWIPAE